MVEKEIEEAINNSIDTCNNIINSCEGLEKNINQEKIKNYIKRIKENDPTAIMVLMAFVILLLVGLIYGLWLNNRELVILVNKLAQNCVVF